MCVRIWVYVERITHVSSYTPPVLKVVGANYWSQWLACGNCITTIHALLLLIGTYAGNTAHLQELNVSLPT